MNRPAAKLSLFASLLAVSVAIKLLFLRGDVALDQRRAAQDLATLLETRGFAIVVSNALDGPIVAASRGSCRVAVRLSPVSGELDQLTRFDFRDFARLRYHYRGAWTGVAPRGLPYLTYQGARAANRMGWAVGWSPVVAVADNRRCDDRLVDLSGFEVQWHRDKRI